MSMQKIMGPVSIVAGAGLLLVGAYLGFSRVSAAKTVAKNAAATAETAVTLTQPKTPAPQALPLPYDQLLRDSAEVKVDNWVETAAPAYEWAAYRPQPLQLKVFDDSGPEIILNPPENLSVTPLSNGYHVSWNWADTVPEGKRSDQMTGFKLQRKKESESAWKSLPDLAKDARSYDDTDPEIVAGIKYSYQVCALGTEFPETPYVGILGTALQGNLIFHFISVVENNNVKQASLKIENRGGGPAPEGTIRVAQGEKIQFRHKNDFIDTKHTLLSIGKKTATKQVQVETTVVDPATGIPKKITTTEEKFYEIEFIMIRDEASGREFEVDREP